MASNALSCVTIGKEDTTASVILDFIWKLILSHVQVNKVTIDHFTVVGLVTWLLNGSEAGVDLVLIQTLLLLLCKSSCSYAN